jgi:hypothetical protein
MAKVQDTTENFQICMQHSNCGGCPSYIGEGKEALYCARGKSANKVVRKGCNCPECPVWINNQLKGMYFCDVGAAR